ncbi:actin filament-associated protein 1-like 2 isoform X4 [Girardinichthys multiradiatus]|uniref:actin filament-associated protein 1-like 2 isoform X4 n=1 Tax=Girardinichthys multiradiatus TaxID=208333 RepID=UPI001FAD10C5|nr:actin filament-associated protein 1-like 2 isoform X4 [Girardinichthys multiradiatus]
MEKHKVLDQLLMELHRFLLILDRETLSGNATIQKGLLSDLLRSYGASSVTGGDEEYIYMNKVAVSDDHLDTFVNGKAAKPFPVPQKSLPDLPPPRTTFLVCQGVVGREPFPLPPVPAPACIEPSESYYEEAQPYEETVNDLEWSGLLSNPWMRVLSSDSVAYAVVTGEEADAVSSSYESYDEEEVTREKSPSAQHQWPSAEASIELMKDARICAFLWRKKWLGQWAKQLCVIKDHRLLCYKSSKDQTPLLDVSLLGCSVIYKEKQPKRKEHKLKIIPVGGEAIVLGLQSKEQTEQWLKVIQEISPKPAENCDPHHSASDSPRLICTKGDLNERHLLCSESGSSTDSHTEITENKDVKKKYGPGLMFSNLMNIGKKKPSSLESPEKSVDTSGYLNVLVNSQWRTCWCLIKNGQLWFYQDKGKNKVSQPAVNLEGCSVLPDPSPEHLYSFRIDLDGTQIATLEAKTSADMGHWLGLLLSQTGTKTDPEDLTYDYVNSERVSSIVNAAKTSLYLMLRRYSESNTYIDALPALPQNSDELYDDVASIADAEDPEENTLPNCDDENNLQDHKATQPDIAKDPVNAEQETDNRIYLDLIPMHSFLHTSCGVKASPPPKEASRVCPIPGEVQKDSPCHVKEVKVTSTNCTEPDSSPVLNGPDSTSSSSKPDQQRSQSPAAIQPQTQPVKTPSESREISKRSSLGFPQAFSPQPARPKAHTIGTSSAIEIKLGKNRTEADMRRYIDERDRLEKEREEVRSSLANLKKEKRETKEELSTCQDPKRQATLEASLKQKEEACREAEHRRVEVELRLVEVKESLKKVESGPFTLGTTLDSSLQDPPMTKAATLPNPQISLSTQAAAPVSSSSSPSQPSNNSMSAESPVNSASALKNRPTSIVATKGNVLQKAKEWEKKSTT